MTQHVTVQFVAKSVQYIIYVFIENYVLGWLIVTCLDKYIAANLL